MAYNNYGAPIQQSWNPQYNQPMMPMPQSYAQPPQPMQQPSIGINWVDGEVGAKAFQIPQGWPINTPIPLWDNNEPVIYLKSVDQFGRPNQLVRIHYNTEEFQQPKLPGDHMSGDSGASKDEIENLKKEIAELKAMMKSSQQNQNGSNQNRGGNR